MRVRRRYWHVRALRRGRQLEALRRRTERIGRRDILVFACCRNERVRLPYFLDYYRRLGADHFLFVDNGSDDGTAEYLAAQEDCSVWRTTASYRRAAFGVDWVNRLLRRFGHGHWCLTVDVDEFLVYPYCDSRPLRALCDWLDASAIRSFGAMLLDMYPRGPVTDQPYREGQDPFEIAPWFDARNYQFERNPLLWNLWIQGGPRSRVFFADAPEQAPALNKTPLVRWDRNYAYVSSTHALLPRGLNQTYATDGGEKASGILLHAKFLHTLAAKASEELKRGEHYADSREYAAYAEAIGADRTLWCKWSERYVNWRQLEILGLISKGNWA
ncbi:glycosyltransferase family 2 protein [Jannaschia sp. W003]|uniref:glycosyltransferase family 2 protein n=1 Tax=Jannaschia sp. W003 TaxID=2867012 RepID=UPI0021A931C0|nr:glycosyltransferase family 2 protein [Jannaschia sp. W003]UWQ22978.1 glycosyltransferase family 2 protein [Jannaschia sp. W003]